jgi:hypothetical protein
MLEYAAHDRAAGRGHADTGAHLHAPQSGEREGDR